MKTFFRVLGVLAVLLIIFSSYIALQPSEFDVQRTKEINAPIAVVFNTINEYKTWQEWGPWYKDDPSITPTYSEITSGVGGSYTWTSEKDGNGGIETIAVEENKSINQIMHFDKRDDSTVYWHFKEIDNKTALTWGMKGDLGFMGKLYFTLIGGADKVFGKMLETGLNNIESYTQKLINKYSITDIGVVEHNGGFFIHLTTEASFDEMAEKMDKMLPKVIFYAINNNYPKAGPVFTLYHKYDEVNKIVKFSTCVPVRERVNPEGEIALAFMEPGRYHKTTLQGAYKYSEKAWEKAFEFVNKAGLTISENGKAFEVYVKGHTHAPNPADWVTEIYLPID